MVPDLLDYLRSAYALTALRPTMSALSRCAAWKCSSSMTWEPKTPPWAAEKLYQILNYRYNAELPTVITTNQNLATWTHGSPRGSRIRSLVHMIPIYATDSRTKGNQAFGSLQSLRSLHL